MIALKVTFFDRTVLVPLLPVARRLAISKFPNISTAIRPLKNALTVRFSVDPFAFVIRSILVMCYGLNKLSLFEITVDLSPVLEGFYCLASGDASNPDPGYD